MPFSTRTYSVYIFLGDTVTSNVNPFIFYSQNY